MTNQKPASSCDIKSKTESGSSAPTFLIPLNIVFYICLVSHIIAAINAPIQDCDETFNYWEPLHYLNHGYGLQTWEYSPEYSIRSWAYIVIHAIPAKIMSLVTGSKEFEFYLLRALLAALCAATETRLYSAISRTLNPRISMFYIMVVAFTPGFFYASVAFLPSSFAMYTSSLALTAFMDWHGGSKTATGIMWLGIGALLGWPFAGALIIPFVLEDWVVAITRMEIWGTFRRYLDGTFRCLIVLAVQVGIDTWFYRKVVVVPWNIVAYNVFSGKDQGPDIFGTEPWHFYIRNLLINFNMWFILAIAAGPLLVLQTLFRRQQTTPQTLVRTVVFISPFYLWFTIFTLQPHKEERFMYPAYPFLALNAAISFHMVLTWLGTSNPKTIIGKVPATFKLAIVLPVLILGINIGLFRILGTISAYSAPIEIYSSLSSSASEIAPLNPSTTVCYGKDWYRFPTSLFLPNDTHAKFLRSAYDGLLPGEFHEEETSFSRCGTWLIPSGMNDRNKEDVGKYTDIKHCTYLIDSYMETSKSTVPLEPLYKLEQEWETVKCLPFLDTQATGLIARILWVPNWDVVPMRFRRVWGEHCLLKRRQ